MGEHISHRGRILTFLKEFHWVTPIFIAEQLNISKETVNQKLRIAKKEGEVIFRYTEVGSLYQLNRYK